MFRKIRFLVCKNIVGFLFRIIGPNIGLFVLILMHLFIYGVKFDDSEFKKKMKNRMFVVNFMYIMHCKQAPCYTLSRVSSWFDQLSQSWYNLFFQWDYQLVFQVEECQRIERWVWIILTCFWKGYQYHTGLPNCGL